MSSTLRPASGRGDPVSGAVARVERFDVIVIGGGQAGLAAGRELSARDLDFVILDGESRVGDAWRRRWDSLRLFTPAAYSGLPGMRFPAAPDHLPDKDEVADYLERYAERFELPVRLNTRVESVGFDGERYVVRAGGRVLEAGSVIVATGPFQRPRVPAPAARLAPGIRQLHSSAYLNPFELPDAPTLVVGAGNSGAQIALELARFRKVWLAGRDTGHLPRRVLGRDIFSWLWPVLTRATVDTRLGRRMRERARRGDALIGIHPRDLARDRIVRTGAVTEVRDGLPVADGVPIEARVVIWCTGFASDYRWIDLPVFDDAGNPRHRRGVAESQPGLFFVGLPFQHDRTSALIGGVGRDAAFVAERVAHRAEAALA